MSSTFLALTSVALAMVLVTVAAPAGAQTSDVISADTVPAIRWLVPIGAVRFDHDRDRIERTRVDIRPMRLAAGIAAKQTRRKSGKAPVVGGMLLGAIAGFLAGNYVQHSVCEFDCGPGAFTWGFTGIGAAGGAGLGLLLR